MGRARLPPRGFTLVEVLVALAAMAVLAALAWRGVDGMLRSRELTRDSIERSARLNTVLTQMRQDLEALADVSASRAVPSTVAFEGRTLRLVRGDAEGLRVVAWSLRSGVWTRWASPAQTSIGGLQEQWLRSLQVSDLDPGLVRLLEGVESLELYCRGADGTRFNCQSTGNFTAIGATAAASAASAVAAPAQQRLAVPRVIELQLTIGGATLQRHFATAVNG